MAGSRGATLLLRCAAPKPFKVSYFSTSSRLGAQNYELVVVGSGAGGSAIASKFGSKLGKGKVAVIEPSDVHYNQAMFTLIGGGLKKMENSARPMSSVIPDTCDWFKDKAMEFDPKNDIVTTAAGDQIKYQFLVVAMGLQLHYEYIKGLPEAFDVDPYLVTNYSPKYVSRTINGIETFKGGNAVFTLPNTPIKCAGAPQKIMYLAESKWKASGIKNKTKLIYNTALGVMFSAPKYAKVLEQICKERGIEVNFKRNLVEVRPDKKEADFMKLDTGETYTLPYDFMHVTPPMTPPTELMNSPIVDPTGYVNVNKNTLQHVVYPNIFAIGDCTNVPTSKTAAAAASQCGVLRRNITAAMNGKELVPKYDGYTSCPLVTSYETCVMAEFGFDGHPMETFPFNQAKERRTMLLTKKHVLPVCYNLMLKGWWEGPAPFRKLFHLGLTK
ncbi:sulfide:quinone oxidoreductase, mitochondrial [Lingula anatina]|uniref:Sulfide:quinone oxidoreductase, mitochondrial n=1 Tax=Lingula anatina TaxID=7574 RepID=A0A1S3JMH7_LINAN|nr:sulfide:quinone oxidoreductase, mitochondrial [Lingula anatina]|eukprot:XP_013411572.1 sulfide:quinone oxidoreductase, mitochondrial [Lingula anatina]